MPPTEILRLLDMVIFNVLACNTDSHAKNYSIMIRGNGVSLAPAYDVMCGEVWENVTKNLVHKIGDRDRGEQLVAEPWRQFARECGLNPRQVLDRVNALAKSVISEVAAAEFEVAAMPPADIQFCLKCDRQSSSEAGCSLSSSKRGWRLNRSTQKIQRPPKARRTKPPSNGSFGGFRRRGWPRSARAALSLLAEI
jgi:hypothetical protein